MANVVQPGLMQLSNMYRKAGVDCPVVMMTRVRDPLGYYLSFYKWGVAFRQRDDPANFGSDFISWVRRVPNLQSTMMMQSMAAMAAEYHIAQYRMHYQRTGVVGRSEEEAWQKLTRFLDTFEDDGRSSGLSL